jgi:hypothetical protein
MSEATLEEIKRTIMIKIENRRISRGQGFFGWGQWLSWRVGALIGFFDVFERLREVHAPALRFGEAQDGFLFAAFGHFESFAVSGRVIVKQDAPAGIIALVHALFS